MQKSYNLYYNLGYWFLLLIALVIAGFYTFYFTVFFQPKELILYIHFALMTLWIVVLMTQPFLIKYTRLALHRALGKISYVLVPIVLFSAFSMIRDAYYNVVADLQQKAAQLNTSLIFHQTATSVAIAFYYFFLFGLFYTLAVLNKRNAAIHARYMLATALTLLGPSVDRIVFFNLKLPAYIAYELPTLILIDFILALLFWKDYKDKRPTRTLWTCLVIYIIG